MNYQMKTTAEAQMNRRVRLREDQQCMKDAQRMYAQEKLFKVAILWAVITGTILGAALWVAL